MTVMMAGCAASPESRAAASPSATAAAPIDRLVSELSSPRSRLWGNGAFPIIELPETATVDEVVAQVFRMTGFETGRLTEYKILNVQLVHIGCDGLDLQPYTAVLIQTSIGEKIALLKYRGSGIGWWSRVYNVAPSPTEGENVIKK